MNVTTTQAAAMKLSDFLFFQQPGVIYGIVITLIAVGATFWLFGHRIHRLLLTVVFLGAGILIGWSAGPIYGVNALLAMAIGGLLGTGIGYWFFHFWLAMFSSALIFLVFLGLYSWQIAVPYLEKAAYESRQEMLQGEIKLAPGVTDQASKPKPPSLPAGGVGLAPVGTAWQELQAMLPKLSRAKYPNWQSWQEGFLPALSGIWERLKIIIPRLSLNLILLGGVALIFGCVLALVRPIFLNIAYTTLFGVLLASGGIGILFTLRDSEQLTWLEGQYWIIPVLMLVLWGVGIGLQYWMLPAPPPPPEEGEGEEDEASEPEKPKGDKKKK